MKWYVQVFDNIVVVEADTAKKAMVEVARTAEKLEHLSMIMLANTEPVFDGDDVIAMRTTMALFEAGRVTKEWADKRDKEIMKML